MAYGITSAATRLIQLVTGGAAGVPGQSGPKAALVLRVENGAILRASLGPAMVDRMMDMIALRLTAELRFLPQGRMPGQTELNGVLSNRRIGALPGHLARLGMICRSSIDLGEMRVTPVINAVIISDDGGRQELSALYAYGREAIIACSPLSDAGQIRFVEYPGADGERVGQAEPVFSPEQIRTHFQPQICCDTGQLLALRVVPRVEHPDLGVLDLDDFQMRLGDDTLGACSRTVLRLALTALRGWDRLGRHVPFLSLSVTDRELADPTLAETILWELDRLDLAADRLEIEVTEPVGRSGGRVPVTTSLQRLSAAGCRIAMGEFGTGSAGLDDLRNFGIRRVRIGRSFIAGCDYRADQQRMILAILALAEHLNLTTLGDGVMNIEEKSFLSQIGFNGVQGKAVAPPLSAAEIDDFLLSHDQTLPQLFNLRRKA